MRVKRSLARRANIAVRHALLKRKKGKRVRMQIKKLQGKIGVLKQKRQKNLELIKELRADRESGGAFRKSLSEGAASALAEWVRNRAREKRVQKAGLKITLKRKQRQLNALKRKKNP